MNALDERWQQLRAVEADLLSPPPMDPFQIFPVGWMRAADAKQIDTPPPPPPPLRRSPRLQLRQMPRRRAHSPEDVPVVPRRRHLSPTQLPGVRAIPKDYNRFFRGLLAPGEFFAKSQTRYLGPFDVPPTAANLPADDDYIILQRMGRLPDSGKSIFRQVGNLST